MKNFIRTHIIKSIYLIGGFCLAYWGFNSNHSWWSPLLHGGVVGLAISVFDLLLSEPIVRDYCYTMKPIVIFTTERPERISEIDVQIIEPKEILYYENLEWDMEINK